MSNEQFEALCTDIASLRHMVLALALASPSLENVVAELERQTEVVSDALIPAPVSDQYIELVRSKVQAMAEANAGRAKAVAHGRQHGVAAGARPAMTGPGRIGSSACAARISAPGRAAGPESARHQAALAHRPSQGLNSRKNGPPVRADDALACQRRAPPPIICPISRA